MIKVTVLIIIILLAVPAQGQETLEIMKNEIEYWHIEGISSEKAQRKAVHLYNISEKYGVDPFLTLSVAVVESNCTQSRKSHEDAKGIMQLTPNIAEKYNIDRYCWRDNIKGGVKFLADLQDKYETTHSVLSHYNSGHWDAIYTETQNFIWRVNRTRESLENNLKRGD